MKTQEYQGILSFGYIYIVILGILKEAFFYSQLGVDYFKYSTIADVLISPISDITSSTTRILVFLGLVILTFRVPVWIAKKKEKSWVKKVFKIDGDKELKNIQKHLSDMFIMLFCVGLMGFYVGRGAGSGSRVSKKIKEGKVEFEDKISFINGKTDTIYLIGKNSSFLFYLPKGKTEIEITPINNGMLKSIIEKK